MGSDERHDVREDLASVGALQEPTRRSLYQYVAGQAEPVSRDDAAAALGISRSLAAFHLDKLLDEGLLEVEYRRRSGRTGPGAGRPAKLYRRATREFEVTLPPRQYTLAAELMADVLDHPGSRSAQQRLRDAARERGALLAGDAAAALPARAGRQRRFAALKEVLAANGFEPYVDKGELRVRNCPFHVLAAEHVQLVCGMNGALVGGAAAQLGLEDVDVRLDPRPGECCVVLPLVRRARGA